MLKTMTFGLNSTLPDLLAKLVELFIYNEVIILLDKGNLTMAYLRYRGKDIISPSTLIFAPIKG